jgi:hypothetical protein
LKRVFSSYSLAAAHHARNLLEVEGIRSVVRNEILSSAMGEIPPAECQIEVWVLSESDVKKANQILQESRKPKNEPSWRCTSCGETSEGQFTQCWRCGAYRSA